MKAAAVALFVGCLLGLAWLIRVPVSARPDLAGRVFTYRRAAPSSCATADGGGALCFETGTVLESTDFPKGTFR